MPSQAQASIFDPAIAKLRRINWQLPPSARRCPSAGAWMDIKRGLYPYMHPNHGADEPIAATPAQVEPPDASTYLGEVHRVQKCFVWIKQLGLLPSDAEADILVSGPIPGCRCLYASLHGLKFDDDRKWLCAPLALNNGTEVRFTILREGSSISYKLLV